MQGLRFIPDYLMWHYSLGFKFVWDFNLRLMRSTRESFSLPLILRTFWSPWKRMGEGYVKGDPGSWASTFIFNSLMRIMGMLIRASIIILGLLSMLATFILSVLALCLWVIIPFLSVGLFAMGLRELLS